MKSQPILQAFPFMVYFIFFTHTVYSQQKIDTIKSYIGIMISSGPKGYFLNEQRIPKSRYEYYKKILDQTDKCTPCWVKDYELGDVLVGEGLYYMDCPIGKIVSYYESGNIKDSGYYKINTTGIWKDWYQNGGCRKEGTWKYYNEKGDLIKTELYENGVLKQ